MEEGIVKEMWSHSHKSNNTNEASSSNNGPIFYSLGRTGRQTMIICRHLQSKHQ